MFFDNFCHESGRLFLRLMRSTGIDIQVTRSIWREYVQCSRAIPNFARSAELILQVSFPFRRRNLGKNYNIYITERIRFIWSSYKVSMHG